MFKRLSTKGETGEVFIDLATGITVRPMGNKKMQLVIPGLDGTQCFVPVDDTSENRIALGMGGHHYSSGGTSTNIESDIVITAPKKDMADVKVTAEDGTSGTVEVEVTPKLLEKDLAEFNRDVTKRLKDRSISTPDQQNGTLENVKTKTDTKVSPKTKKAAKGKTEPSKANVNDKADDNEAPELESEKTGDEDASGMLG